MTPHRCPEVVGSTRHPAASAADSASSTSFFGWRLRGMLTFYNSSVGECQQGAAGLTVTFVRR